MKANIYEVEYAGPKGPPPNESPQITDLEEKAEGIVPEPSSPAGSMASTCVSNPAAPASASAAASTAASTAVMASSGSASPTVMSSSCAARMESPPPSVPNVETESGIPKLKRFRVQVPNLPAGSTFLAKLDGNQYELTVAQGVVPGDLMTQTVQVPGGS